MPKAFTPQQREMIGERLIQAGVHFFSTFGLKKTSVSELAAAAGISKAAFYLFYPSKEALYMQVVELAEQRFRREILAVVDLPGPSPRARLAAVLRHALTMWKTIPVLRFFTSQELVQLSGSIPAEIFEQHLASDREFLQELADRCRLAGIPFQVPVEEFAGLSYALLYTSLHESDLGPGSLSGTLDLLIELTAAYCLGEVTVSPDLPKGASQASGKGGQDETGD